MRFAIPVGTLLVAIAVGVASADEKSYGLDKRIAWNHSKVVGSPDPPLPYQVKQTFTKLKIPYPIAIAREPGTTNLIVAYQLKAWIGAGRIVRIKDDPDVEKSDELLALDGIAYGVTFHPDFEKNGYIYVGSNGPLSSGPKKTRVTRYTIDRKAPHGLDPDSAKVIIEWESDGHNGGDVAFGKDGMLYVTSGDGTSDSDTNLAGQDISRLLAKVLRIDVDHPDKDREYSVPKDNPFVDVKDARPETWAYGFRNPWRIHIDRATGDVFVGQNGQDLWEQVYLVEKGANYGWSVVEGGHPFYPDRKQGPTKISKPFIDHHHSEMRSLTGGLVYHGKKFPDLQGAYIYGDWSTGRIWGVKHEKGKITWHKELANTPLQITGFGLDSHGEILIADHGGGAFYQLEVAPKDEHPAQFPRKLSETGLFTSVKGHETDPALIPYSVNAPLWSDGADKERFIALPGESKIDFSDSRGWNFPEGTVLVKTFFVASPARRPQRIETRLLTRQIGKWVGYSYLWNNEQSDADLVPAGGTDREYDVWDNTAPDKKRKQKWHYPSRTECMVCHSRAANFALGLNVLQMNKVHNYGDVQDNQLRTLEHIGVFSKELPKAPTEYPHLVDPYDAREDLDKRARSYLHANCAICHVEAGGGNAKIDLEFGTAIDKMRLFDIKPSHHTYDIADARLIAPGDPDRSVLLERLRRRGDGQMPPLASARTDTVALEMLRQWVKQMKRD